VNIIAVGIAVLPSKGHDAYTRFYCCIAEEIEHRYNKSSLRWDSTA